MQPKARIISYYALNMPEFNMPSHTHKQYEIMYAAGGECTVFIEGEAKALRPNHFVVLYPGVAHRLHIEQKSPCLVLNLEWEFGRGDIDLSSAVRKSDKFRAFFTEEFGYKLMYDKNMVVFALKDLINTLEQGTRNELLSELAFVRLMLEICEAESGDAGVCGIKYVKKAKEFIDGNIGEELSVDTVAKSAGISRYYLQSLFKRHLGQGVTGYINSQRIKRACFLLQNTGLTVTETAFEVGFNSRQHFSYIFEKQTGLGPMAYKKRCGQNIEADTVSMKKY